MVILSKPSAVELSCHELIHTWHQSCNVSALQLFVAGFKYSLKIYAPLYTIAALIRRKQRRYFLYKLWREILQSAVFLACACFFMMLCICNIRKCFGTHYMLTVGLVPGFISSFLAVLVERKDRRGPLAVYMTNVAAECIYNIFKEAHYISPVPFGEVLMFSAAMAVTAFLCSSGRMQSGIFEKAFKYLMPGDGEGVMESENWLWPMDLYNLNTLKRAGQAFVIGYGIQMAQNMFSVVPVLFKQPGRFAKALYRKSNWQMASFLGSLVLIFRFMNRVMLQGLKAGTVLSASVAGAVSGLSMLFERSQYLSLYFASKSCELACMHGIDAGYIPYFEHFDSFLYAACCAVMFHSAIVQPNTLSARYLRFLKNLTANAMDIVNRKEMDAFGLQSSKMYPDFCPSVPSVRQGCTLKHLLSPLLGPLVA